MKVLTIEISSLREGLEEFKEVYKKVARGERVRPTFKIAFENLGMARKFLTPERLRLLRAVREERPKSIYELAKIVERDFRNTYADVKSLEEIGVLTLKGTKKGRRHVRPEVTCDEINLRIAV